MPALWAYDIQTYRFKELFDQAVAPLLREITDTAVALEDLHQFFGDEDQPRLYDCLYTMVRSCDFFSVYSSFVREVIQPRYEFLTHVQDIPSIRIQFPGSEQRVNFHTDEMYGHSPNTFNFWLPLTNVGETNALYFTSKKDGRRCIAEMKDKQGSIEYFNEIVKGVAEPKAMKLGEVLKFDSSTVHGTVLSKEVSSRVSFDFRATSDLSDIGIKDQNLFRPIAAEFGHLANKKIAALYFGIFGDTNHVPSQKYQQMILVEYCRVAALSYVVLETELSGFDYYPSLVQLLARQPKLGYSELVIYSQRNLPAKGPLREKLINMVAGGKITVHDVCAGRELGADEL